ncbi:uncharacterized protein [Diadema antillarum]|uniref:uncharacterized protein n=1 Tax=Diadema antillarum TaxID=105358 RepID=UPI003A8A4529
MEYSALLLCVCLLLPSCSKAPFVNAQDARADIPAHEDPGHNAHQEGVIFGCLGLVVVLAVFCTMILCALIQRTRFEIRRLDEVIPKVVERMRKEMVTANGELMSGTLTASHEFQTEFLNEDVQLTSYRRRNEADASAEASANAEASAPTEEATTQAETSLPRRDAEGEERSSSPRRSNRRERQPSPERRERYERHAHLQRESRHSERLEDVFRAHPSYGIRPPPPPYLHGYDNPGMMMNDEASAYRHGRRPGPRTAPKPAHRSSRPVSAYLTSGNEYPDESPRPVSVIGLGGDDVERQPRRHGHGRDRKYKSLLYESHV